MKRFLLISLILMAGLAVWSPAQSQEDSPPLYLIVSSELPPNDDTTEGVAGLVPQFFDVLRANLLTAGVSPIFIAYDDISKYPDYFVTGPSPDFLPTSALLSLQIRPFMEQLAVYVSPFGNYMFPPLPLGHFGWQTVRIIQSDCPDSIKSAADITSGIGLYVARECEAALSFLESDAAAIDASGTTETELIVGTFIQSSTRFYRAGCAYHLGDIEAAIALYEEARTYDAEPTEGQAPAAHDHTAINLAWLYLEIDEADEARALLDTYRGFYPPNIGDYSVGRFGARADLYLRLGEPQTAIAEFDFLLELALTRPDPFDSGIRYDQLFPFQFARIYAARGHVYAQAGQSDLALTDFNTAIENDPDYAKVYFWRGILYLEQGLNAESRADLERFLSLAADNVDIWEQDLQPLIAEAERRLEEISNS